MADTKTQDIKTSNDVAKHEANRAQQTMQKANAEKTTSDYDTGDVLASRQDILNPNLHYGLANDAEVLMPETQGGAAQNSGDYVPSAQSGSYSGSSIPTTQNEGSFANDSLTGLSAPSDDIAQDNAPESRSLNHDTAEPTEHAQPNGQGEQPLASSATAASLSSGSSSGGSSTTQGSAEHVNHLVQAKDSSETTSENVTLNGNATASDLDGDSISYSLDGQPEQGTVTLNADGSYSFAPGTDFDDLAVGESRTISFDFTADDGNGSTDTGTISIEVTGTNDAPTAVDLTAASVSENNAGAIIGTLTSTDVDTSDTHSYTVSDDRFEVVDDGAGNMQLKLKDGVSLDHEAEASVTLSVTSNDGNGGTLDQNFTINVADLNEAVTANDGTGTTSENITLNGNATASDLDGDSISYSLDGQPEQGTVTLNADGSYSFAPGTDFDDLAVGESRTISFDFTADDGNGLTDTGTISIEVTGTNDAPTAIDLNSSNNGISLNEDSGNNAFVSVSENGDILGDQSQFTVEITFSVSEEAGHFTPLLSYSAGTNQNDFLVGSHSDEGVLSVYLNNQKITTSIPNSSIYDGGTHDLAVVRDSDDGSLDIYIDGQLEYSVDNLQTGVNLTPGGTIVLGQEQDSVGGSFATNQVFVGDIDEVAIFSQARDISQIQDDATNGIDSTDAGLNAHWGFSGLDPLADLSGNDHDLSEGHVEGSSWSESSIVYNQAVSENNAGAIIGTLTSTDVDTSDTHSYTVSDDRFEVVDDGAGNMQLKLKDGVSLDHEVEASVTLTITSDDGNGGTLDQDFTINVADLNEAVTANDGTGTTSENVNLNGNATASDLDGDSISYSLDGQPEQGTVTLNADGSYSFAPGTDFDDLAVGESRTISFDFTADDGNGSTDTGTISIEVTGTNDAPTAVDLTAASVSENNTGAIIGTLTSTDVDTSDTHSYTVSDDRFEVVDDGAGNMQLKLKDDVSLDHETEPNVTLTITSDDGNGGTASDDFTINVADLNEAPVLSHEADNLQDFESDADGWSNTTRTDDGSSNTILGRFGFESGMEGTSTSLTTPDAAESTVIEFDLLEIDSWDGRGDNYSGNSGAEMIIIEVAGETIEIPMDFNWSNETASGTSGNVSWTLVTNDENTNDMFGGYNDQVHQVQITVNNPNSAIDFSISSSLDQSIADEAFGIDNVRISNFDADGNELLTVSENDTGASIAILSVADPDEGDSHTYAVSDERFEVVEQDGQMTLKLKDGNSLDHEVEDTVDVVVTVTDSGGLSDSQTLTINVGDVNEAPSLSAEGSFNFLYNGSFENFSNGVHGGGDGTGWYQGATIDGWTQTDIDVHEAGHMGLGASDGDYHVDLAGQTNGELSRAMDGLKDGDEYTVTLDLKSRGADGSGKGSAEDAAGQSVVQVSWNGEVIATIDPSVDGMGWNSYALNITAGSGDGSDTITFTEIGSDNNYGTILDNFQITDSDGFGVLENETGAEIAVLGVTDPDDADTHTYSVSDDRFEVVDNGSGSTVLKLKDGNSLDHETEATLDVTVTVTDSGGLSDSQTLTIDVGDLNEAVTANDGTSTTSENASLKGTATASDLDGDSITYSLSAGPTQGSVTVNADGSYSFVPGTDFDDLAIGESRTVSFDFTADDGNGLTDTGTISIEVTGTNDAPTAVDLTASDVTENNAGAVIGTLSSSDADTSDTHSYTVSDRRFEVADDGAGNMQLKLKDGVSLNHETEESVTLTVTSNDGNGGSFDQDFTINVADVNEAVTAYDYSYNISEGQNLGHSMMANDVDGDQASFKIVDGPSHGSIAFNSNPSMAGETRTNQGFQFSTGSDFDDLAAGETRTVTVDFEAADGNGSTDTGTLTFNVAGTNDGPTAVDLSSSSVTENNAGAVIGTLSTTDVDTSDTHTYSVSDDRFEVVDDGAGNMQLKLKDRVALDHETEENIALTITSDDGNGGTMSEDFTIAVADVNEGTRGLSITGTSMTSGQAGVINTTNWSDTENGYTVTAQNLVNGELSEASAANIDTWDSGLGANGGVTHTDSGMDNQLAYDSATGQSETVIVDFDKDVSSASFDFQHLYSSDYGEEGHYQAYNDGKLVGEGDFTETGSGSGTGTVDVAFDQNFDQIVFSSNMQTDGSNGSDYQITEVTYQEAPTADGNDVLTGSEGNDKIAGLSGDDTITGGLGDDIMAGGDGNDMFLYMIGDGSDHIDGGAGADWTDSIELFAADGSNSTQGGIGEEIPAGDDWTLNITSGSVSDSNDHEFLLSDDASGTIDFADGSQIEFENIDRIAW